MPEPARLRPSTSQGGHSINSWISGLGRLIRSMASSHWYGTIRVEVFDGRIKRILLEKSIVDPSALARGDDDPIESP